MEEDAPESVLVVIVEVLGQQFGIQLAVYAVVPFVEFLIAGSLQACLVLAYEFQQFLWVIAHLHIEGGHGDRKVLYLLAECLVQFLGQFPVGAGAYVHVLLARIVIVPGKFL